jgi:hypothetical protein
LEDALAVEEKFGEPKLRFPRVFYPINPGSCLFRSAEEWQEWIMNLSSMPRIFIFQGKHHTYNHGI